MRLILVSAVFALAATTAAAQTSQQFDLVCRGTLDAYDLTTGSLYQSHPIDNRYRLDLDRRVWCVNDCQSGSDIGEVTQTRIVLTGHTSLTVNRLNGEMRGVSNSRLLRTEIDLRCTVAPYTLIPAQAF